MTILLLVELPSYRAKKEAHVFGSVRPLEQEPCSTTVEYDPYEEAEHEYVGPSAGNHAATSSLFFLQFTLHHGRINGFRLGITSSSFRGPSPHLRRWP